VNTACFFESFILLHMDKETIINRISELRTRAGLSARQLSIKAGLNERYINSLESHRNHLPSVEALMDIINALGSTPMEFFYSPTISAYVDDRRLLNFLKGNREMTELLTNAPLEQKNIAMSVLKLK